MIDFGVAMDSIGLHAARPMRVQAVAPSEAFEEPASNAPLNSDGVADEDVSAMSVSVTSDTSSVTGI